MLMQERPCVSIIVPAFNAENTIERCLRSIIAQDLDDIQVVVGDDCSTDGTAEKIRAIAADDKRVLLVQSSENRGVHAARRMAFGKSTGRYVGFVDADDTISPRMYSTLLQKLVDADASVAMCSATLFSEGEEIGTRLGLRSEGVRKDVLGQFCRMRLGAGVLWNKLYRREVIERPIMQEIELKVGEDYVINFGAFKNSDAVVLCRKKLYNYWVHSTNLSRQSGWEAFASVFRAYATCLEAYAVGDPETAGLIDELYIKQLYMPGYRVPNDEPAEAVASDLAESLGRIARISPRSIYHVLHSVPRWLARLKRVRAN